MREIFSQSSVSNVSFGFADFTEAFSAAKNQSQQGDLLLVFGSFFWYLSAWLNLRKSE